MPTSKLVIFCNVLLSVLILTSPVIAKTQRAAIYDPSKDPFGDADVLPKLVEGNAKEWSSIDTMTPADRAKQVAEFSFTSHVDVCLVGFKGDGNYEIKASTEAMIPFLEASLEDDAHATVLHPVQGEKHELPIKQRFQFKVSHAREDLLPQIASAVQQHASKGVSSSVPVDVVDSIIAKTHKESPGIFTIYVLNLPLLQSKQNDEADTDRAFVEDVAATQYWYIPPEGAAGRSGCPTTMWVGKESNYAWVDLTAGPLTYGHHTAGEGLVTEFDIPVADNFRSNRMFANSAGEADDDSEDGKAAGDTETFRTNAFLSSVAAYVRRSSDILLHPPLLFHPTTFWKTLKFHIVHITVGLSEPSTQRYHLEVDTLKNELSALAMPGQKVIISDSSVTTDSCGPCASLLHRSIQTYTSVDTRGNLRVSVSRFIDSKMFAKVAVDLMETQPEELRSAIGMPEAKPSEDATKIIPIFLFKFPAAELPLIDRKHQALALPQFVLAVQGSVGSLPTSMMCGDDVRFFGSKELTRPLMASMAEAGWSLAPQSQQWNSHLHEAHDDFLWDTAMTPFGHLSTLAQLNSAQKSVAHRNLVYAEISETIGTLYPVFRAFERMNISLGEAFNTNQHQRFMQAWNVMQYKWEKTSSLLSRGEYSRAMYYARSCRHEVKRLVAAVRKAGIIAHGHIACDTDTIHSILRDAMVATCMVAGLVLLGMSAVQLAAGNVVSKAKKIE